MARYADDLVQVLDSLDIREPVVCGLSMGGYIAFELLRQVPTRIRALILCNTKAVADTPEGKRGRDALAARAQKEGARGVANELVPKLLARATHTRQPTVVREVTEMIERQPVSGIVGALRALRDRPDSTPLLARIRVPVLVVAGDDDQVVPAAAMQEMAAAIAGSQFVVIPGAGHLTPLEQPAALNQILADFLSELG
jgi:pimeloyl-ACP methyl ester carboxylesterase